MQKSIGGATFYPAFRPKNLKQTNIVYLRLSFSNGSCNVGVFDTLWWWWWCWFDVSWCKWFKLLLPDDMRPVIADDTLTADATESCKLWWLCKWSLPLPLCVPGTKSCRHNPCASDIFWSPRSILPNWYWIFRLLSVNLRREKRLNNFFLLFSIAIMTSPGRTQFISVFFLFFFRKKFRYGKQCNKRNNRVK